MALRLILAAGLGFLFLPVLHLVLFSFNDSRLVTAWTGFSWRWYGVLLHDQPLIDAAMLSLRVASGAATLATLVGTAAGLALARFGRFAGRRLFAGSLAVPLVMPDVVTGLSLLLGFVFLQQLTGWPSSRGALTMGLAHASVSVAYVAIVVRARLAETGRVLEEAAADLYAPPLAVFARITLPLLAPALGAGWLLAFTLSFDDVVIASFTTGPGATTLPMVMFSTLRLGPTPEINALATLMVGLVGIGLVLVRLLQRSRAREMVVRDRPVR